MVLYILILTSIIFFGLGIFMFARALSRGEDDISPLAAEVAELKQKLKEKTDVSEIAAKEVERLIKQRGSIMPAVNGGLAEKKPISFDEKEREVKMEIERKRNSEAKFIAARGEVRRIERERVFLSDELRKESAARKTAEANMSDLKTHLENLKAEGMARASESEKGLHKATELASTIEGLRRFIAKNRKTVCAVNELIKRQEASLMSTHTGSVSEVPVGIENVKSLMGENKKAARSVKRRIKEHEIRFRANSRII